MINLDTHILVGVLLGELTARERRRLEGDSVWGISPIVLWELAMLAKKGRISLDLEAYETRNALSAISVLPLSLEVARVACNLDFNADPADHLIAATSIVHKVPLLTRDKKIRSSKRVPLA